MKLHLALLLYGFLFFKPYLYFKCACRKVCFVYKVCIGVRLPCITYSRCPSCVFNYYTLSFNPYILAGDFAECTNSLSCFQSTQWSAVTCLQKFCIAEFYFNAVGICYISCTCRVGPCCAVRLIPYVWLSARRARRSPTGAFSFGCTSVG